MRFTLEKEIMQVKCGNPLYETCKITEARPKDPRMRRNWKWLQIGIVKHKIIICSITSQCNQNYIGQTGTKLTSRAKANKQQIKRSSLRKVSCIKLLDIFVNGKFNIFFCFWQNETPKLSTVKEKSRTRYKKCKSKTKPEIVKTII